MFVYWNKKFCLLYFSSLVVLRDTWNLYFFVQNAISLLVLSSEGDFIYLFFCYFFLIVYWNKQFHLFYFSSLFRTLRQVKFVLFFIQNSISFSIVLGRRFHLFKRISLFIFKAKTYLCIEVYFITRKHTCNLVISKHCQILQYFSVLWYFVRV